jgi:hypothetical protein
MRLARYANVPATEKQRILAASKKAKEEED